MDPFVGEIRIMPYSFAPRGWAPCNGQLLPISQNTALFALLGTQYGGNGQTTFALPNLNGQAAIGVDPTNYPQGTTLGTEFVTLLQTEMPAHTHGLGSVQVPVNSVTAGVASPAGAFFAKEPGSSAFGSGNANGPMAAGLLSGTANPAGGNQPHENRMPFLAVAYCIATQGIFPQRQ